jgi:hypothetical protein
MSQRECRRVNIMSIQACRDARCNGTHLLYSSHSSSTSASDAIKHVADRAVARSINDVNRLSSNSPLLVHGDVYLRWARWAKRRANIAKMKTAV